MRIPSRSIATLLLVVGLALAACSGDDAATTDEAARDAPDAAATHAEEGAGEDGGADADHTSGGSSEGDLLAVGAPLGRMVIRTAELEIEVDDTAAAVERVTALVERAGGFVAQADLARHGGDELVGTMTLRVPTDRLGSTLTDLEELATEVLAKRLGSDDVTEEYSDIEAQLRNLRALETELLDLLAEIRGQSDSAEEILRVFERIRQVREEIEMLQGRQQVLEDLVDLATIDLRLTPSSEALPLAQEGWSPGGVARDALRTTVGALQGLADVAIWIVLTALPILMVLAAPLALAAYAARRWRHRPVRSSD